MTRFRTHFVLFAALVLTAGFALPIHGYDGDDAAANSQAEATPVVTLVDAGAEPRRPLRLRPQADAKFDTEMVMRMKSKQRMGEMQMPEMVAPPMRMVLETVVEAVAEDGDITASATYTDVSTLDAPGGKPMVRRQIETMLGSMRGMSARMTFTDRAVLRSAELQLPDDAQPMVREQIEGMAGSMDQFTTPLPEEPVGLGAKWTVLSTVANQGMIFQQTATYTLKAIDGDVVDLDMQLTQTAEPQELDAQMPGATARLLSLSGKGSGTARMNLTQVMPVSSQMVAKTEIHLEMTMQGQSQQLEQQMEMDISITALDDDDASS